MMSLAQGDFYLKDRTEVPATELVDARFQFEVDSNDTAGGLTNQFNDSIEIELPLTDQSNEVFVITNIQFEVTGWPNLDNTGQEGSELSFATTDPSELSSDAQSFWAGFDKQEYIYQWQRTLTKGEPFTDELQSEFYYQTQHEGKVFPRAIPYGSMFLQCEQRFATSADADAGVTIYGRVEGYVTEVEEDVLVNYLRKFPR